jgi:flagellar motor switch protein FliN/FliY
LSERRLLPPPQKSEIIEQDRKPMDETAITLEPSAPGQPKEGPVAGPPNLGAILSIPVTVQVVLGSTSLPVAGLMKLARGAIVSLDQRVGDPVDVVVNGTVVARGEIVVVDDASQRFGVSLIEVVAGADFKPPPTRAPQESGHA